MVKFIFNEIDEVLRQQIMEKFDAGLNAKEIFDALKINMPKN